MNNLKKIASAVVIILCFTFILISGKLLVEFRYESIPFAIIFAEIVFVVMITVLIIILIDKKEL